MQDIWTNQKKELARMFAEAGLRMDDLSGGEGVIFDGTNLVVSRNDGNSVTVHFCNSIWTTEGRKPTDRPDWRVQLCSVRMEFQTLVPDIGQQDYVKCSAIVSVCHDGQGLKVTVLSMDTEHELFQGQRLLLEGLEQAEVSAELATA